MDFDSFREALERQGVVVFTLKDAGRVLGKPLGYAKLFLSRLVKRGKLQRIERGKFCARGADAYAVASNLVFPSYVSFLSALAFHGLTTQVPVRMQVACARQRRGAAFGGMQIEFVRLKKSALFGFRRFGDAFVAEPEKAVVDGLYLPRKLPLSEALYAIRQKPLDAGRLCECAERLGSSVVKRRLGLLLEKAGAEALLAPVKKATRYALLNPALPPKGEKSRRWMLVVNEVL